MCIYIYVCVCACVLWYVLICYKWTWVLVVISGYFWVVVPRTSTKAQCYAIDINWRCTGRHLYSLHNPVTSANVKQLPGGACELLKNWNGSVHLSSSEFIAIIPMFVSRFFSVPRPWTSWPRPAWCRGSSGRMLSVLLGLIILRTADLTVLKHTGARDLQGKGGDHTREGSAWVASFLKNMASSLKPSLEVALGVLCRCRAAHGQRLISMITMQATECRESPDTANCPNYFQVLEPQIRHDMCWYIMIYCILLYAFVIYCDNLLLHNHAESCRTMPVIGIRQVQVRQAETWHAMTCSLFKTQRPKGMLPVYAICADLCLVAPLLTRSTVCWPLKMASVLFSTARNSLGA